MATIAAFVEKTKIQSEARLTFVKSGSQLNISASVDLRSSEFHALNIDVKKFPLVYAINAQEGGPLVIDYNFDGIGRLECGFIPKVVVLSGIQAAKEAKRKATVDKVLTTSAWIGNRALKVLSISASDVSCNDLQSLIYRTVCQKYSKEVKQGQTSYIDSPYVIDVYLFDNYCILGFQGSKYRQYFNFDRDTRVFTLTGDMVPVVEEYVDAPASSIAAMSLAQTLYDKPNSAAPALGGFNGPGSKFDYATYGAPGSEANNPMLKMMLNVEEALQTYLVEIAKGVHKVCYSSVGVTPANMLNAAKEARIAAKAINADASLSVLDFLHWQDKKLNMKASQQTKLVQGEAYIAEEFAHVGDPRDISTWFYPLKTSSQILAAKQDKQLKSVPRSDRSHVKNKILNAAMAAVGTFTSGRIKANNPHKFLEMEGSPDVCKRCKMSSEHPLHKVK